MYEIFQSNSFFSETESCKSKDGSLKTNLQTKIEELAENPFSRAKSTNIASIGDHYVNIGNTYSVTFDIDENSGKIFLHKILRQARLYKILQGHNC
jgi:hypothetical protein